MLIMFLFTGFKHSHNLIALFIYFFTVVAAGKSLNAHRASAFCLWFFKKYYNKYPRIENEKSDVLQDVNVLVCG